MKKKVIVTRGLSGCGKTTFAKQYVKDNPGTVLICKDDIRQMLGVGYDWSKSPKVNQEWDEQIIEALRAGKSMVIADTNLDPLMLHKIKSLVHPKYRDEYEIEIKDFRDVDYKLCIERCAKRPEGREYWEKVILKQKDQWLPVPIAVQDESLPRCVITDYDGTIVIPSDRDMFSGVGSEYDTKNEIVCEYLMFAKMAGYDIIILSGLEEHYRYNRESYLHANAIEYDALYMRATGDSRKDFEIKEELFDNHIKGKYFVHSICEDRPQMVRFWIDKGYSQRLFSVGNIFHEF